MSGRGSAALALVLATAAAAATALPARVQTTAVVGATLVDGTGRAPVPDAVVVVQDGRIACAGSRAECALPPDARVVDARGAWLIPGLVDAHVHYSQTGWADGRPDALDLRERFPYEETVAELHAQPERFYRSYLCAGVTATFDVGGYPWTWDLRGPAATSTSAPHVAAAGPLLSTRDHWVNVPPERQFVHTSTDSATRAGARYAIARGTDALKVWYLVGRESPDTAAYKQRLRVAAEEARRAGIPLIVHATGLWQAKDALRAGAKLLVHSVYEDPVDDEFLELARRAGAIYTPTLTVFRGYVQLRNRDFDPADQPLECVDPETRRKAFLTDSLPGAPSAERRARAETAAAATYGLMLENLRRVHAAGIPIAMGTDAGNPLTLHGASVFAEMEAMQEAGMRPIDVLESATRVGAVAMGMVDRIGTVEAGKIADLVLLAADPTADIANVRRIRWVMRGGEIHARTDLKFEP